MFSVGMYVVVYGLRNAGLTTVLGRIVLDASQHGLFVGTLATGFLAAILSSVMNNLPAVLLGALAIHSSGVSGVMQHALVYANVIGADLGPKMTPIGSLATLLWLHVLARKGISISWRRYILVGVVLTVPTLFVTLCSLTVWTWVAG